MSDTDPRTLNLRTWPLQPKRRKFVLVVILAQNNFRHARKAKGVSFETMEDRRQFLFRTFDFLENNDIKTFKIDPRSLSGRHVEFLFAHWERRAIAGELGPSSLQKCHSYISTFAVWIGKPGLVKPIGSYISDPKLYSRTYVAMQSRAWTAKGVDPADVVEMVADFDERAAAQLAVMHAFGLRFKEAVMFRPHMDVVSAAQAGKANGDVTEYLALRRGTKGGRQRYVPVNTPEQMTAIERARRVVCDDGESLSDPRMTLVRAIRHLRYVMEKFGITKRQLGVTPHGLRHSYASAEYGAMTGIAAPVETSTRAPIDVDREARLAIAEQLGHSRGQITNAYLGSSRRPRNG